MILLRLCHFSFISSEVNCLFSCCNHSFCLRSELTFSWSTFLLKDSYSIFLHFFYHFLSSSFSQLTNSLFCFCQQHKVRTNHFLAVYSLCKRTVSWVIHRSVAKQQETVSPCYSFPPPSIFCCRAASLGRHSCSPLCQREGHRRNSAEGCSNSFHKII